MKVKTTPINDFPEVEIPENFHRHGVFLIRNFISKPSLDSIHKDINCLIKGQYPTGLLPDKLKKTRKENSNYESIYICNGWKSSRVIKEFCTLSGFGKIAKKLIGWSKVKLNHELALGKCIP